jgi:hypothetical protein
MRQKLNTKTKKDNVRKPKDSGFGRFCSVKWVRLSFFDRLKMYMESVWASVRFFPSKQYPHISFHKNFTPHN